MLNDSRRRGVLLRANVMWHGTVPLVLNYRYCDVNETLRFLLANVSRDWRSLVDLFLSLSAFEPSAVLIEKHESEFDAIGQRLIFSSREVVEWFRRTSRVQSKGAN